MFAIYYDLMQFSLVVVDDTFKHRQAQRLAYAEIQQRPEDVS